MYGRGISLERAEYSAMYNLDSDTQLQQNNNILL